MGVDEYVSTMCLSTNNFLSTLFLQSGERIRHFDIPEQTFRQISQTFPQQLRESYSLKDFFRVRYLKLGEMSLTDTH